MYLALSLELHGLRRARTRGGGRARAQIRSIFVTHGVPLAGAELEALDAGLSLEVWERLRDQGCTRARADRVLHETARTLARAAAKVPRKARVRTARSSGATTSRT